MCCHSSLLSSCTASFLPGRPLEVPSSLKMVKAGNDSRFASRMWSCSELQEGMKMVMREGENPAEMEELQVRAQCKSKLIDSHDVQKFSSFDCCFP